MMAAGYDSKKQRHGALRYIEREGERVLQQAVEIEETDPEGSGERFWIIDRWDDVPFVEACDNG